MPRFQQRTGDFEIATGADADPVVWRFERTPEVEREFTLADDPGRSRPRPRTMLPVMLGALAGWEGVLDAEGRAIEYSEEAFYEYIPSSLRLELLSRWTQRMRGAEGGADASAGGGAGGAAREEVPGPAFRAAGSTASAAKPRTPNPEPPSPSSPAPQQTAPAALSPVGGAGGPAREEASGSASRAAGSSAFAAGPPTPNPQPPFPSSPPHQRAAPATLAAEGGAGGPARDEVRPSGFGAQASSVFAAEPRTPNPEPPSPPPPARAAHATSPSGIAGGLVREAVRGSEFGAPGSSAFAAEPRTPDSEPLSLPDDPDLDMDWDFEDAVEAIYRRNRLAEQHEPLY